MKISLKEKLGLCFIELGSRLFFKHTPTGYKDPALEQKLELLTKEVNAQTLLGCEIYAGGHGYNTPDAPVINHIVAVSIRDVLTDATKYLQQKDS